MSTLYKLDTDAIYLHIPFCVKKCEYCDFTSFQGNHALRKQYVEALKKELHFYEHPYYDTIYFGGGTPSLLEKEDFVSILELLPYDEKTEITVECNPKTLTREKLQDFYEVGINRLSIGVQSTQDSFLKLLGRLHSFEEAEASYRIAREIGFQNISLDFMFSFPKQSLEDLEKDLEEMLRLSPEHLSIYSLIWEEDTPFFEKLQQGIYQKTDNALEAKMYEKILEITKNKGYEHYEISNFAKKQYESRHNRKYWKNQKYLGVGLGASGYISNIRYTNTKNLEEYFQKIEENRLAREEEEELTEAMVEQYQCLLEFRQIQEWISIEGSYQKICEELVVQGYLEKKDEKKYRITQKGLFFFNDMLEYFL